MDIIESEEQNEKKGMKKSKDILKNLQNYQADQYMHYEKLRKKRGKEADNLFEEIVDGNFPSLRKKKMDLQILKNSNWDKFEKNLYQDTL